MASANFHGVQFLQNCFSCKESFRLNLRLLLCSLASVFRMFVVKGLSESEVSSSELPTTY